MLPCEPPGAPRAASASAEAETRCQSGPSSAEEEAAAAEEAAAEEEAAALRDARKAST